MVSQLKLFNSSYFTWCQSSNTSSISHSLMGFFQCWKRSVICPIPKIKDSTLPQHYRSIAILPAFSKALERIMREVCDQIRDYLEENELWDPFQFAYRRSHSTETGIIRVLDDVRWAIDKRMVTIMVLFDFSKAFDRVQHRILLQKLNSYSFSHLALCWIKSYLVNRSQVVQINLVLNGPQLLLSMQKYHRDPYS